MIRTFLITGLCVMVSHTLARQVYPILLTAIQDEFGLTTQRAGWLVTATFLAYMVGVGVMTYVSGRVEPKTTMMVGLALASAGFAVLSQADRFAALAAGIGVAGLGSAGIWLSAPVLVTGAVSIERRGMAMGFLSSSIGVGLLVVGQAIRLVRSAADDDTIWRPIWVGSAVFTFALVLGVALLLHPPETERVSTKLNLDAARQVPGWIPLTGAYLLFGLIVSAYAPFLGAALEDDGFSRATIATLYSLVGVSAIFGALALGRISDRIGRRPVLGFTLLCIAVACLLVVTGRGPLITASVIINGSTSYAFPVLVTAQIRDHLSDRAFSNALGAITFIYGTSLAIGPLLAGAIAQSSMGFDGLYSITAGVAVLATVIVLRVPLPAGSNSAGVAVGPHATSERSG